MFSFLKRIFRRRHYQLEVVAKAFAVFYHHCLLAIGEEIERENIQLAFQFFMIGACDCASQSVNATEAEFFQLVNDYFCAFRAPILYRTLIFEGFVKSSSFPAIQTVIVEGGRCFSKTISNAGAPGLYARQKIREATENPSFPASQEHLRAMLKP
jgi:hypothetical protein